MGYNVSTTAVNLTIPARYVLPALESIKHMDRQLARAHAAGQPYEGKWYTSHWAWMNMINIQEQQGPEGLVAIFTELGFDDSSIEEDGTFRLGWYDSKTGDEEHFLNAVAPFVTPGSTIEWTGEEEEHLRMSFDGTNPFTQVYGTIVYE